VRRALFVVFFACGSQARTEVAIAPPQQASAIDDHLLDAAMNADPPPNNQVAGEDALVIQMTPPPPQHGIPVVRVDNETTELGGQRVIIRRVLRQNAVGAMRACYAKGLAAKSDLAGRVVVRFAIDSSGNVSRAESTTGTTLASPAVVACVVDAIKPLVFPQRQGGTLTIDYPIVFQP
jgi:hypothetical protein